ncbi:hypothetical protein [Pontiella sp.]|uniref:hypothetical protein n=1 Tax=Pontiella sp. TaxID=2837462 RepID=UPI003562F49A
MTNINLYKVGKPLRALRIPMIGILALLASSAFSAPADVSGTNDALKPAVREKRDPFWPVGYVPERMIQKAEKVVKPTTSKDWAGAMKKVVINGVSSRGHDDFFAVVNGELKSVGDTFSVDHNGTIYTWAVASIQPPGSVSLRRVSAM